MTPTITLPRATVEQALEAMRCAVPTGKITLYEWDKAMAAFRAALAEDALDRLAENERALGIQMEAPRAALAQQAEPVATVAECEACFTPDVCQLRGTCDYYTASQMRIAAPQQQAEPVEPVAAERERCAEYLMQQAAECREDSPTRVTLESCAAVLRLGLHAQAEPVEPVAWAFRHSDGTYHDPSVTEHSAGMVPLYPPHRSASRPPSTINTASMYRDTD